MSKPKQDQPQMETKPLNDASKSLFLRAKQDYELALQAIANQAIAIDKPGEGWVIHLDSLQYIKKG